MNIFKKYFEKKKEAEQPKPVNKSDLLSRLQRLTEKAEAEQQYALREVAIKEAFEAFDGIVRGMLQVAARGESKYIYTIKDQSRDRLYLNALQSEFKTFSSFKDMDMISGHVSVDRGSSDIGIAFSWKEQKSYAERYGATTIRRP
jgi:hypothetical protein